MPTGATTHWAPSPVAVVMVTRSTQMGGHVMVSLTSSSSSRSYAQG